MDLADIGRALRRHLLLSLCLVILTLMAAAAIFTEARLTYATKAAMVVLSPTKQVATGSAAEGDDEVEERIVNPFLNFGGSQETAAQVLTVRMSDDAVGRRLEEDGLRDEWTFAVRGDSGSVIEITSTGPDPATASASADLILAAAADEFATLQREAGAPDDQLIRIAVVNTPSDPEPVYDAKIRMAVMVGALGALLTVSVVMVTDSLGRARRARRQGAMDREHDEDPEARHLDDRSDEVVLDDDPVDVDLVGAGSVNGSGTSYPGDDEPPLGVDDALLLDALLDDTPPEDASSLFRGPRLAPSDPAIFHRAPAHDLVQRR
jgi:hypothetical protein